MGDDTMRQGGKEREKSSMLSHLQWALLVVTVLGGRVSRKLNRRIGEPVGKE